MTTFIFIIEIVILFAVVFLSKYLQKKAQNIATKEDVAAITREVESVRAEISREQSVLDAKYRLKHEACMEALSLIDAQFSHIEWDKPVLKQYMPIEKIRECHSKLILTCENTEIVEAFSKLVMNQFGEQAPTDNLNEFRNMVRQELGFGGELDLAQSLAWFGNLNCGIPQADGG